MKIHTCIKFFDSLLHNRGMTKSILLGVIALSFTVIGYATDYTSNNVTGNWSNPSSWAPAGVPGAGDNVTISQGTITVDVASSVTNITIAGGTIKLNTTLTVNGTWLFNSGTFTHNNQTVVFGTGGVIGGSTATTFYNLTINTTNSTDAVSLTKSGIVIANNGTLTITKGIFKIGSGNVINMGTNGSTNITVAGSPTGNFASANDGSGLNTDADGGTINQVAGSGNSITVNGAATFYNFSTSGDGNWKLNLNNTGVLINGTLPIKTQQFQCNTNSPAWGPNSNLNIIYTSSFNYTPGKEWLSMASGTAGVTAGYPNNVTLSNTGTSAGGYNNGNGWVPSGVWAINGVFTLGNNSTNAQVDFSNVTSFTCGGFVLNTNSRFTAPKATMTVNGSWTDNQAVVGTTKGFFINGTSNIVFGGSATCAAPSTISAPTGGTEIFNNLTISANVTLLSPVVVNTTGVLTLSSGILTTTSLAPITVNNTSTSAIVGGSATSLINGPVKWNLAATAGMYVFPVGTNTSCYPYYLPFTFKNIAGNAAVATVQAFNTGTGGTVDGTISSLSNSEYWSLSTSPALNAGATVSVAVTRLTPIWALGQSLIAKSNILTGVYTSIGGTASDFAVVNSNDIGAASQYFFSLSVPPIVSTLAPTSITTTGATLQGAFNTQGASHNTSFSYGTNTSSGLGTPATIHSPINSTTSVLDSAIITGLTANTIYTYKATDGINSGSDVVFATAPNPPVIGIPSNTTCSSFVANWSAPAAMGTAPYTYTVQISTDPGFASGIITQTGISSALTSATFTGLGSATTYYVRVEAVNQTGPSVWSATSASVTTNLVPSPPCNNNTSNDGATTFTTLIAAPVIDGTIDPIWTNAPTNPINVTTLGTNNNTQNWKSLWTTDSLYILVQVTDASLISQGSSLNGSYVIPGIQQSASANYYEADGIEFYIDPDYSHGNNYDGYNDVQLRFNLGSSVISGQSVGGVNQFAGAAFQRVVPTINWIIKVVPGGYLLEAAIPWGKDATHPGVFLQSNGTTYGTPTSGQTIGIDVNVNDQDNVGGGRQAQIQWFNSSTDAYLHPNVFSNAGLQVCPEPPIVNNPTHTAIAATSAILGATVVSSGKDPQLNVSPITTRGTAYEISTPVVSNAQAEGGTSLGAYAAIRTGLTPQTKYYYVGYANNAAGLTGISEVNSFYTLSALPTTQPTLTVSTCAGIKLDWSAITFPPVNQATQSGYLLLRRQDGNNPTATGIVTRIATQQSALPSGTTLVATINSGSTLTYTDATAVSGTTYNYMLVPFTWDGVVTDSTFNYFTAEASTITATVGAVVIPTFDQIAPICAGGNLNPLPTTSNNLITGTWAPALNNQETTTYTFTPSNGQCAGTATMTITVSKLSAPVTTVVQPTCNVSTGTISVTSPTTGVTYSFDNGQTFQNDATSNSLVAGATYQVIVKSTEGCLSAATPTVINAAPQIPSAPTTTVAQPTCSVNTGTITITAPTTGVTYSFDNGQSFQSGATSNALAAGLTYQVLVKNNDGCVSPATPTLVNVAPQVPAVPTTTVVQPTCTVNTGTITVTAPTTGVTYSFDNGQSFQNSATSNPINSGTYQVLVKNNSGCISSVSSVVINTAPQVPSVPTVTVVQPTCTVASGTITVTAPTTGVTYSFDNGQTFQNGATSNALGSGSYQIKVKSTGGCISSAVTAIINAQPETPVVNAGADMLVAPGGTVTLAATATQGTYLWSPGEGLSSTTILRPDAFPAQTTTYTLTVTNDAGCSASDDVKVTVQGDCLNPSIVFTPNRDGYYDLWQVFNRQCIKKLLVDVYNRWGGLVYHNDNYDNNWDGTYKGKDLPDATYYYVIKATFTDGHVQTLTGNVTIMR